MLVRSYVPPRPAANVAHRALTAIQRLPYAVQLVLLAALYFGAARVSLCLAIPPGYATPVWPPSGIALAAVVLLGHRVWPGVWLGAAAANFMIEAAPLAALVIATGNMLEALVGGAIIRRFIGVPQRFARGEDVVKFVATAALCAMIAATIGLAPLALQHALAREELLANWLTWWQGDASGMIIITPLILTWTAREELVWTTARRIEVAAFTALLLVASLVLFVDPDQYPLFPLRFLILPFIVWAAFRFSQREVTSAI